MNDSHSAADAKFARLIVLDIFASGGVIACGQDNVPLIAPIVLAFQSTAITLPAP